MSMNTKCNHLESKGDTKMKSKRIISIMLALSLSVALCGAAIAQSQKNGGHVKTDTPMIFHGGPIMTGTADVYVVWYGCWDDNCGNMGNTVTQGLISQFLSSIGGSPYF